MVRPVLKSWNSAEGRRKVRTVTVAINKTTLVLVLLIACRVAICQSQEPGNFAAPIPKLSSLLALTALERGGAATAGHKSQDDLNTEGMSIYRIVVDTQGRIIRRDSVTALPEVQALADDEISQWHFKQVQSHGIATPWWSFVGVCYSHLWPAPQPCSPPPAEQGAYTSATLPTRIFGPWNKTVGADEIRTPDRGEPLRIVKGGFMYYPPLAKVARVQGSVELQIAIGSDGRVLQVTPVAGHPLLVDPTLAEVRRWNFAPLVFMGQPVEAQIEMVITYALAH